MITATYLVGEPDIAGLNAFRDCLNTLPTLIDSFLKNLDLGSLENSKNQTMINVVARAKRDTPLWPGTANGLRRFHQDVTPFINDTSELVTQLKLYERPEGTDSVRENLNTLSLHAAPFNMNGKLGISPASKTYDVTYFLSNTFNQFDAVLYKAIMDMKLIQQSVADVIPRTVDFMRVTISEHEAQHRRPDANFTEPVKRQLESANSTLESLKIEYSSALQAANNMHAYCNRLRELLHDSKSQVLGITYMSNVRSFLLQMNLMGTRITEAERLINRIRDVL